MSCAESEKHFPGLLRNELRPAERISLQAHLGVCPSCREEVAGLVELSTQLDGLPMEQPSPDLRIRFYQMLDGTTAEVHSPLARNGWRLAQAAAIFVMVGGGFLAGYWVRGGGIPEVSARNQNLVLLSQGGPDLRVAGVMLTAQGDPGDPAPAEALLDMLDRDPNESVRLATVDALYLYGRQPQVRERLAASLGRQTSPRVQLALVDLLGGLREQRALEALRALLHTPGTTPEVVRRVQAQLENRPL